MIRAIRAGLLGSQALELWVVSTFRRVLGSALVWSGRFRDEVVSTFSPQRGIGVGEWMCLGWASPPRGIRIPDSVTLCVTLCCAVRCTVQCSHYTVQCCVLCAVYNVLYSAVICISAALYRY